MKNTKIASNVVAEIVTHDRELGIYYAADSDQFIVWSKYFGGVSREIFRSDTFGPAGRFFLKEINLDKSVVAWAEELDERRKV